MVLLTLEARSQRNGKTQVWRWNWRFNYSVDQRYVILCSVFVCLFVLGHSFPSYCEKSHPVWVLQPSATTLPPGSIRFPGVQSKLKATPDLLTSAVSALIKAESTQCAPRSFAPVHTIFALSASTADARMVTYAEAHTVAHQADPESTGGRKRCHLWLLHLAP